MALAIGQNPRTGSRYSCIDLSRVILYEALIKDLSISSRVTIVSRTRFTPFQPGRVRFELPLCAVEIRSKIRKLAEGLIRPMRLWLDGI